jgi:hypothetical protein
MSHLEDQQKHKDKDTLKNKKSNAEMVIHFRKKTFYLIFSFCLCLFIISLYILNSNPMFSTESTGSFINYEIDEVCCYHWCEQLNELFQVLYLLVRNGT